MDSVYKQMDAWYQRSLGSALHRAEKALLSQYLPDLLGTYLVQVGGPTTCHYTEESPVTYKVYVGPEVDFRYFSACIAAEFDDLPFLPESVDVILLPHVLGSVNRPKHLLNETYHILEPGGHLVILGFNPFSLWGLQKPFKSKVGPPWTTQFIPNIRVRRWLKKIGFHIVDWKTTFYRMPIENKTKLAQQQALENVGQLCWPFFGAVYMIVAEKRVEVMTPIKEKSFIKKPVLTGDAINPTTRVSE